MAEAGRWHTAPSPRRERLIIDGSTNLVFKGDPTNYSTPRPGPIAESTCPVCLVGVNAPSSPECNTCGIRYHEACYEQLKHHKDRSDEGITCAEDLATGLCIPISCAHCRKSMEYMNRSIQGHLIISRRKRRVEERTMSHLTNLEADVKGSWQVLCELLAEFIDLYGVPRVVACRFCSCHGKLVVSWIGEQGTVYSDAFLLEGGRAMGMNHCP